jgi:hypothetical protein
MNFGKLNNTFYTTVYNEHIAPRASVCQASTSSAMLSPSFIPPHLIPSTFLPPLPRSQLSFDPLTPADLLELYIPPIHGGFSARDYNRIDDNGGSRDRQRAKERRFSAGLSETMDGLGLGLGLGLDTGGAVAPKLPAVQDLPEHEHEDSFRPVRENDTSDNEEYDDDEDEDEIDDMEDDDESEQLHLDPFEREWAEKWLGGVVRRAQSWLEANEPDEDGKSPSLSAPSSSLSPGKSGLKVGAVEMVLRDATAVLAMMAGTSGECLLRFWTGPFPCDCGPTYSQTDYLGLYYPFILRARS